MREQTDRIVELERENERLRADLEDARASDVTLEDDGSDKGNGTSRAAELVDALRETAESAETDT